MAPFFVLRTTPLLFGIAKVGIFSLVANFSGEKVKKSANFPNSVSKGDVFEIVLVSSQSYVGDKIHIGHSSAQA